MRLNRPASLLLCGSLALWLPGCATHRAVAPENPVAPALARSTVLSALCQLRLRSSRPLQPAQYRLRIT